MMLVWAGLKEGKLMLTMLFCHFFVKGGTSGRSYLVRLYLYKEPAHAHDTGLGGAEG